MDEDTEAVYGDLAVTYAANRTAAWPEHVARFLARADPGRPVLDAGCGTGLYLPELSEHPAGAVGTDRTAAMLARAGGALRPRRPRATAARRRVGRRPLVTAQLRPHTTRPSPDGAP